MFSLSDYNYTLDESLIAQEAAHPHHDARMMVIHRDSGTIEAETTFWHLDEYLGADRVIFFNDSRVLRSRVTLHDTPYIKHDGNTGTIVEGEIFYLSSNGDDTFSALVRPGNKFKIGTSLHIGKYQISVIGLTDEGRTLRLEGGNIRDFLEEYGALPLPPYIEYKREKEADYQTNFAKKDGSVAAPTASLHFTKELLEKIEIPKEYLTLHVGLGTFKGIQTEDIRDYDIHREKIEIPLDIFTRIAQLREIKKKIVAVGTTAMRTLESLPYLWQELDLDVKKNIDANTCKYWDTLTKEIEKKEWVHAIETNTQLGTLKFETSIYITPGYIFRVVDDLITNFHLGGSSLLVLVSAFLGYEETRKIYAHAIANRYRFYSFGDGMYIRCKPERSDKSAC